MPGPIVVFSDLHFGERGALLRGGSADPAGRARVDALYRWLTARGPFEALIFLGDIWDLWFASFAEAREQGNYALRKLSGVPARRLVYVPGNHDHHVLVQHQLLEQITALRDDHAVEVLAHSQREYTDSFLAPLFSGASRDRLLVAYPDHVIEYGGCRLVFHHGHHTAILREGLGLFSFVPRFILERWEGIGMQEMTRSDVELAATIFFEMVYAASLSAKTRARIHKALGHWLVWTGRWSAVWGWLLRRLRLVSSEAVRGTSAFDVEFFREATTRVLELAAKEHGGTYPCDVYVFGHTHRAGITTTRGPDGEVIVVNSGCWLYEPRKDNRENEGTFVLIDSEQIGIYFQAPDLSITLQKAVPLPRRERSVEASLLPGVNTARR
jgi:UDP-2,3-diacylglucosamine pyrophosphatase LpxH